MSDNLFRQLPSVNDVLAVERVQALCGGHSHDLIVTAVRAELTDLREQIRQGITVDGRSAVEVDRAGKVVWEYKPGQAVWRARRR